jgi:sugar phosphate isomerase/epimerase
MADVSLEIGLVTEALIRQPLTDVMDWLVRDVPEITGLEIGTGAYAPTNHCDMQRLLSDASARAEFRNEVKTRGLHIAALNVWGNPLHPDPAIGDAHDRALHDTIRLAAELDVDRIVGMAGCPAATEGEHSPHFAAGGWLPYLENVYERQWNARVQDYWTRIGEFAQREHPALLICLELHPGTVGHGHDAAWWRGLLNDLRDADRVRTISIEHEDPFVAPEIGIREAAQLLSAALKELRTAKALA